MPLSPQFSPDWRTWPVEIVDEEEEIEEERKIYEKQDIKMKKTKQRKKKMKTWQDYPNKCMRNRLLLPTYHELCMTGFYGAERLSVMQSPPLVAWLSVMQSQGAWSSVMQSRDARPILSCSVISWWMRMGMLIDTIRHVNPISWWHQYH